MMRQQQDKSIPEKIWIRIFKDGGLGGGSSYCRTPPEGFDSAEYVRINKDCDHIIGMEPTASGNDMIAIAKSKLIQRHNENPALGYCEFNNCPLCGAKNNWEELNKLRFGNNG